MGKNLSDQSMEWRPTPTESLTLTMFALINRDCHKHGELMSALIFSKLINQNLKVSLN